jgi:cbb3-type cytochrome oxidase subunit 3
VIQEFYASSEWLTLPLVALVFFFLFFLAVLCWVTFGLRDRKKVDRLARLPFESRTTDLEGDPRQESDHG